MSPFEFKPRASKPFSPKGHGLKENELWQLSGLIEYRPRARYDFSAGQALGIFLEKLKEGKIVGSRCPRCGRIYVPPRSYCEYCLVPTVEIVEVPDTGTVHTAVISYIRATRERMEKPEIVGIIRLDVPGYREDEYEFAGLFHKLCGVSPEDVTSGKVIGMKVRAKWKPPEERKGSILDIECFEPY